jgi:hypothetical protein
MNYRHIPAWDPGSIFAVLFRKHVTPCNFLFVLSKDFAVSVFTRKFFKILTKFMLEYEYKLPQV